MPSGSLCVRVCVMAIESRIVEPLDLPMAGGDDFAGWGRVQKIISGDPLRTVCESRLMQRWQGVRDGHLGRNAGARELVWGLIRAMGTDAPACNSVFLRTDRPDCNVVATIEYGSGSGNEQFQVSVGAGTNVFLPGTFWRVSLATEAYQVATPAGITSWPPDGIEVLVHVNVGRGTGAQNTAPSRTVYRTVAGATTERIPIPARSIKAQLHVTQAQVGQLSIALENVPGAFTVADYRPTIAQDQPFIIPPGATAVDLINPAGAAVSACVTFFLG